MSDHQADRMVNMARRGVQDLNEYVAALEAELAVARERADKAEAAFDEWQNVVFDLYVDQIGAEPPRGAEQAKKDLSAFIDAAREREAAMAAALEPFVRFAKQVSSSPNWVPDGCPVNVDPGGISDLAVGAFRRAEQALADPTPILARVRREAKREALREWRAKFGHYTPGENTILDEMDAALAALEQEGANL